MRLRNRLAALLALALAFVAGALVADRPLSYSIRDVLASDIRKVCIAAVLDEQGAVAGLHEEWTFEHYATTGAPQGQLSVSQYLALGAPGTGPIMTLMQNRLPRLNQRLDDKYSGGIPNPLATPPETKPNGGDRAP